MLNRGLHGGDLLISSAILFSGNNFNKIELFAKILHMGFPSQSSFTKLQRKYLVPAVDDLWEEKQGEMTAEMADKDLVCPRKRVASKRSCDRCPPPDRCHDE